MIFTSHLRRRCFLATWLVAALAGSLQAWEDAADRPDEPAGAAKAALEQVQVLVGEWKGVGQPRRGTTQGSWITEAAWRWDFSQDDPALVFEFPDPKIFASGRLTVGEKKNDFQLVAAGEDAETKTTYVGQRDEEGRLLLTADKPAKGMPARISIRSVAQGDRLLILLENRIGDSDRFARLAEIGYTRKGSNFGQGGGGRECIVTGGAGTIAVEHNGQTYYVCCSGCRDYFLENPEEVLAEYKAKKAAEKNE